jgi:hypothetical protein
MPFNMLMPQPKKTAAVSISSGCGRGKNEAYRLTVSIPTTIYTLAFNDADKVNISLGTGTDEGKLLIVPSEAGHFETKHLMHTVLIKLPANPDITPDFDMKDDNVERREWPEGALVLTLPTWANKTTYEGIKKARAEAAKPLEQKRVVPMSLR